MDNLNEKLDFNFSYKDCETMDRIIKEYLSDRKAMYEELFLSDEDYTLDDIRDYTRYFCSCPSDSEKENSTIHSHLPRICHFLTRDYGFYLFEEMCNIMNDLYYAITDSFCFSTLEDEELDPDEFEDAEYNCLQSIEELWNTFLDRIIEYPLLNLDKMEYSVIDGTRVYYKKDIQPFIQESFTKFLSNIKRDYPNTILGMDSFVLISPDYIELCAGEGTQAFFTDDMIFYSDSCTDEDRDFAQSVFYHEFGHYIYSLLSETMMEYWHESYQKWKASEVRMTRDEEKNSQIDEFEEELFADTFSTLYVDNGDDAYIHKPSPLITDTLKFILDEEFI